MSKGVSATLGRVGSSCAPEGLRVKVHAAIAFISHPILHDGFDVFNNLGYVLADSGHNIWSLAAKGVHVFQELCLVASSMVPADMSG